MCNAIHMYKTICMVGTCDVTKTCNAIPTVCMGRTCVVANTYNAIHTQNTICMCLLIFFCYDRGSRNR